MATVGAYEAKTHLASLLRRVAKGEQITITKHGVPIARLVPVETAPIQDTKKVVRELLEFREKHPLGDDLSIRKMIEEGRRY